MYQYMYQVSMYNVMYTRICEIPGNTHRTGGFWIGYYWVLKSTTDTVTLIIKFQE
jgi:hypothetical protein